MRNPFENDARPAAGGQQEWFSSGGSAGGKPFDSMIC